MHCRFLQLLINWSCSSFFWESAKLCNFQRNYDENSDEMTIFQNMLRNVSEIFQIRCRHFPADLLENMDPSKSPMARIQKYCCALTCSNATSLAISWACSMISIAGLPREKSAKRPPAPTWLELDCGSAHFFCGPHGFLRTVAERS